MGGGKEMVQMGEGLDERGMRDGWSYKGAMVQL